MITESAFEILRLDITSQWDHPGDELALYLYPEYSLGGVYREPRISRRKNQFHKIRLRDFQANE